MATITNVYTCVADVHLNEFSFIVTNNKKREYTNVVDEYGNGEFVFISNNETVITTTVDGVVFENSIAGIAYDYVLLDYTRKSYTRKNADSSWSLKSTEYFSEKAELQYSKLHPELQTYTCDIYTEVTETTKVVQTCKSTIIYEEPEPFNVLISFNPAHEKCEGDKLTIKIDYGTCVLTTSEWETHTDINGNVDYYLGDVCNINGALLLKSNTHSSANPFKLIVSSAEQSWDMSDYAQPFDVPEMWNASAWGWDSVPRWSWKMGEYAYLYNSVPPDLKGTGFYIMREGVPRKMNFFIVRNGNVRGLTFKMKKEGENG